MGNDVIQQEGTLLSQCEEMYSEYGRYINKWRAFPLIEDGLKLVERRVLFSEYLTARKKFTKSAEVVGYCMGKLHPHGDCLHGDTVIPLVNGKALTIKQLAKEYAKKSFYVYSYDINRHKLTIGLAYSPRVGQVTDIMYKITLSNGKVIKCTKNHPFLINDCGNLLYVRAEELTLNKNLVCIDFSKNNNYIRYNTMSVCFNIVKMEKIKLKKPIEFYDITVDTYHNFAIGQGIFVHNSSIYGSLVQLCNCGLSDYNGNFGTDIGLHEEPPAAMRYTEVKMNEDVVNMAFKHLDFVPFESLELPMKEPVYLATKLPFCLIRGKRYTVGIGFGFDTYIPSYSKEDLVKRLKWLLTKEGDEPIIKPVTDCDLDNTDEQYRKLLIEPGPHSLKYIGKATLDKKSKSIVIHSISPSKQWSTILNAFKDEIQVQKSIGYIDESCEDKTAVRLVVIKRGQDLDKIYKKVCKLITSDVKFRCNMCDTEGNIQMYSVDQMLLRSYQRYKKANIKLLEFNIQKCQQIIDELNIIQRVKNVLPQCLKDNPDDINKLILQVHKLTSIEIDILKGLFEKYTIPRFTRCKTDITEKQNIKTQLENNLNTIDNFVWRLYENL